MGQRTINTTTTTTTFWQHQRSLWKSSRGTVNRIEVFALVAIVLSFLVVLFGSCRRWSKRWIFQKGILAANALSLSLGIYCIGLMQSSGVKSEMYPVWAISLLTLFGSTDSIVASSLDYNSQIIKLVFQLCLYCGYVLLIGISTTSSDLGKISIGVLCAITFIKGFHRSLGCVLLTRLRELKKLIADCVPYNRDYDIATMRGCPFVVDWPLDKKNPGNKWERPSLPIWSKRRDDDDFRSKKEDKVIIVEENQKINVGKKDQIITIEKEGEKEIITIDQIWDCNINSPISKVRSYKDVCLSFSLSHLLQLRFFGFSCAESAYMPSPRDFVIDGLLKDSDGTINYERVFRVVEVELAFLYDVFFTNNAFLHYYESKAATVWGFASFTGICLVGVATLPAGTRTTRTSGGTTIVNTTTYDLIITAVIVISLALLQLLLLIRCWTSDWARVSLLCQSVRHGSGSWQMRLKERLCRINWFEDNYRWQRKLGQYSLVESISTRENLLLRHVKRPLAGCLSILRMAGSQYVEQVFEGMLGSNTGNPVELGTDVKKAIVHYLVHSRCVPQGPNLIVRANGLDPGQFGIGAYSFNQFYPGKSRMESTWIWHIATCYMEMELSRNGISLQAKELNVHFGVATKLSKYCAYLVVSVPQLLPEDVWFTKSLYNTVAQEARQLLHGAKDKLEAMRCLQETEESKEMLFSCGVSLGKRLEAEIQDVALRWKVLADFWADKLIDVAVSDNLNVKKLCILSKETRKLMGSVVPDSVKEHFEHLAKGGEFITRLWALLYHANIDRDEARACWDDREEMAPEYHHLRGVVFESGSSTSTDVDRDQDEELQGEGESAVSPQEIQVLDGTKDSSEGDQRK